jgi:hypothetical protein
MHPALRREIEGGVKTDYGTNDSREPEAVRLKRLAKQGKAQFGNKRSIVHPPTEKMGKKLYLDQR